MEPHLSGRHIVHRVAAQPGHTHLKDTKKSERSQSGLSESQNCKETSSTPMMVVAVVPSHWCSDGVGASLDRASVQ